MLLSWVHVLETFLRAMDEENIERTEVADDVDIEQRSTDKVAREPAKLEDVAVKLRRKGFFQTKKIMFYLVLIWIIICISHILYVQWCSVPLPL